MTPDGSPIRNPIFAVMHTLVVNELVCEDQIYQRESKNDSNCADQQPIRNHPLNPNANGQRTQRFGACAIWGNGIVGGLQDDMQRTRRELGSASQFC